MTPEQISAAAQSLFAAEQERRQIGILSESHPQMTLADAYAVQDALVVLKQATARRQIGWKIGLTSRAMQQALQIETPDSGVLFDDMLFPNGGAIPPDRFIEPRIEAEIAFVMKSPLQGAQITREDVIAATDYVCPALEILDTRVIRQNPETGARRLVQDTIADNAANAGLVLGDTHLPPDHDMRWLGAIVSRDGVVEETGLGAGVLNDPVTGIVWLVQRLAELGQGLEAGQVVLSGSFIRPIECKSGTVINASFGKYGNVEIQFG
ncbi:2-oxo-hept-4-ene-1,7-dioate hydratase [Profundibacter sp.]|uniref:2-oxo-hept-4-ene-1,7-dioate hydratase n=1 Tax=Profundibacter sp. TaxID=3101071 RepID=UPI003D0C9F0F